MPRELIHIDTRALGRLHCDNPRCGHDLDVPLPFGPWLIGYRCPKCHSDMLTKRDYDATEGMLRWFRWVNKWFGWLGSKDLANDPRKTPVSFKVHDGNVEMRKEKK